MKILLRGQRPSLSRIVLAFVTAVLPLRAETVPAGQGAAPVLDVQVFDEVGRAASFRSMVEELGPGPVILLPIYTRCAASCLILTRKLEGALAEAHSAAPRRVVLFSFDPVETSGALAVFRKREHVPPDWKIVRANGVESARFFRSFGYSIMNEGGMLIHPNAVFLLDEKLNWRVTLVGEDWRPQELARALEETRHSGFAARVEMNPDQMAWVGLMGLITSFSVIVGWLVWRKPSSPLVS